MSKNTSVWGISFNLIAGLVNLFGPKISGPAFFENTGSVHVRPRGLITITNWRDKKVADVEFPQKNVLPGSKRKVETSWDVKWLFGKYTATVVGSYGTSNTPLSPWVVSFWVFPWKIGSVVGGTAFLILLFFFLTRRRWATALGILLKGDKRRR